MGAGPAGRYDDVMPDRPDTAFLPDFCEQGNLLRTMLSAELLAIVLVAAMPGDAVLRLQSLALVSLFIQWVALVDIALLCALQRHLGRLDERTAAVVAFVLLQAVTLGFTVLGYALTAPVGSAGDSLGGMLIENGVISAVVTAVALRYFYVTAQWRRNIEAEAQARVQALQARIRPHFLFNSMNTIASLTRSDAVAAEAAVEDLSELFRASLAERSMIPLAEELALVASYLRIEAQRLGTRLRVDWDLDTSADDVEVPALTLQPLVENSVYHGVEPLGGGGRIGICTLRRAGRVEVTIRNPRPRDGVQRDGNRMAQDNVRQRLALAFGDRAELRIEDDAADYVVTLQLPAPGEETS